MFIIWGSTGRETVLGQGEFHCPQCRRRRPYSHVRVARYFTVYFIPLFPTQTLGEYVRCQVCQQTFQPAVLAAGGGAGPADADVKSLREDLQSGIAIEQAREELLDAGLSKGETEELLAKAVGGNRARCPRCDLAFIGTVKRCSTCDTELSRTAAAKGKGA